MSRQLIPIYALTCAVMFSPAIQAQSTGDSDPAAAPTTTGESTDKSKASFDASTGELRITCLEVTGIKENGKSLPDAEYDVVMVQRGNSSNWEITFAEPGCATNENMLAAAKAPAK